MRKSHFLQIAIAMLAGCGPTVVKDRPVEIIKPVAVQPIAPKDVPAVPAPLGKRPADARSALDLALSKVCEFVGYALKADPLLRVSSGEKPGTLPKYPECEPH